MNCIEIEYLVNEQGMIVEEIQIKDDHSLKDQRNSDDNSDTAINYVNSELN